MLLHCIGAVNISEGFVMLLIPVSHHLVNDAIFETCHWAGEVADMSGNSNPHTS